MAEEEVQAASEQLAEMAVEDEELTLDLGKKKKKKSKKIVSGRGLRRNPSTVRLRARCAPAVARCAAGRSALHASVAPRCPAPGSLGAGAGLDPVALLVLASSLARTPPPALNGVPRPPPRARAR